jgi:hypothetical protein
MNKGLVKLALFVRDLLDYDEADIRIGRLDFDTGDFSDNLISIDALSPATRLSGGKTYDGDDEVESIAEIWNQPTTITFWGDDAFSVAEEFIIKLSSQASLEIQEEHELTVFKTSQFTDVKRLTGQQYNERFEITLNIHYNLTADIDTLRIDTEQLELLTDY